MSCRGGPVLFWSNFLLLLETGAQSTSPHLTPWRRAGCEHRTKCVRSLIYITGKHYLNYKREQIRLLHSLFLALFPGSFSFRLFPLSLSLFLQPQLQTIHTVQPMLEPRTGHILCFLSLLCLGKVQLPHSTPYSLVDFVVGVGTVWQGVLAC